MTRAVIGLETDDEIRSLLRRVNSIAVVGVKTGEGDDAYRVPRYLQERGYRIAPVSPNLERALGEPCVPTLADLASPVDLVCLFRAPSHIPDHATEILALPARPAAVWMQLGIRHDGAAARLRSAGIAVVQDRCMMVEHGRLLAPRP